jgi:hypothetical protein
MSAYMKNLFYPIILTLATGCANAQSPQQSAPEWKAVVKVVDDTGQPLEAADVTIGYYVKASPGHDIALDAKHGKTDINGLFTASEHSTTTDLFFGAGKEGYYRSHLDYELGLPIQYDSAKWSPNVTLLLKRIGKPIPMYAKRVDSGPPVFNTPVGYDFVLGDWLAPHGKGQTASIIFLGTLDRKSPDDFDYTLTVSFPNTGDGIQEFIIPPLEKGSGLLSPHEAPLEGYQQHVYRTMSRHLGSGTKDDSDTSRNYFLRVQTVLDDKGNVKTALYGKIYGDFMRFRYYLNPSPNSRNVEFDPKRNLVNKQKSFENVDAP